MVKWWLFMGTMVLLAGCGGSNSLDEDFMRGLTACEPAQDRLVSAANNSMRSADDLCFMPDKVEPDLTALGNCWSSLPMPDNPDLKTARSDLLMATQLYRRMLDETRVACDGSGDFAKAFATGQSSARAIESAMMHVDRYKQQR